MSLRSPGYIQLFQILAGSRALNNVIRVLSLWLWLYLSLFSFIHHSDSILWARWLLAASDSDSLRWKLEKKQLFLINLVEKS